MTAFYVSSAVLCFLCIALFFLFQMESSEKHKKHIVSYNNKKLIIDEFFIVASFRRGSLNCELFEYLNANQNKEITLRELEDNVFRGRNVNFCKVVDSFGFRGDLKKVFFSLNDDSITYHPDRLNSQVTVRVN